MFLTVLMLATVVQRNRSDREREREKKNLFYRWLLALHHPKYGGRTRLVRGFNAGKMSFT